MRKSIVFMSAALTAFVMAMLAGVVGAYKEIAAVVPASTLQQNAVAPDLSTTTPVSLSSVLQATVIPPQEAASIAAKFLNRKDLYSIEIVAFNGTNAYKVSFSSGDVLYVSLSGQVLSYVQAPTSLPQVFVAQPSTSGRHGGGETEHEGGGD